MRNRIGLSTVMAALALVLTTVPVHAQGREEARLLTASQVLNDAGRSPVEFIPSRLLERAYGIAVVPDVTKVAFFLAAVAAAGYWWRATRRPVNSAIRSS